MDDQAHHPGCQGRTARCSGAYTSACFNNIMVIFSPKIYYMFSRNLSVPDFVRRFFVSCTQISEAYAVRTLMKFGCDWRKIGHKGRCRKDSERTSKFSRRSCVRTGYPSFTFLCRSPVRLFHGTLLPPDEGFHLTAGQDRSLPVPVPP